MTVLMCQNLLQDLNTYLFSLRFVSSLWHQTIFLQWLWQDNETHYLFFFFYFYQSLLRESKSTSIPSQGFWKSISFKTFHVLDAKPLPVYFRTETKFLFRFMIKKCNHLGSSFYLNPAFKMIYENIYLFKDAIK